MARIITKELAEKIVKKLGATKSPAQRRGAPHDLYDVQIDGLIIAIVSLRRGSEKDKGHDHIPAEIHLGPNKAKSFAQCNVSLRQYEAILREKKLLPELDVGTPEETKPTEKTGS